MSQPTSTRVDKWLWSVRAFKTRTSAGDACASGKVRINGEPAKPASKVVVGDRVEARRGARQLVFEVTAIVEKRVGAAVAATCYVDYSPVEPQAERGPAIPGGARDRGAGRPTKRDRRVIDQLRGRDSGAGHDNDAGRDND
ncbi:MAG: RNA-binding S4 domain-containing protein [Acidimicrobiales bacterium]